MKHYLNLLLLSPFFMQAQNIGVGTAIPAQKLEVNGAIKIGTTSTNLPGTVRYNAGKFEGGTGTDWKSLEGLPSKAIILAQSQDTIALKAAGFTLLRTIDLWDTAYIPVPTNFAGTWAAGFPAGPGSDVPAPVAGSESVMYSNTLIYYGNNGYLYLYDIASQKWRKSANISPLGVRSNPGVTLVGNDIYITGGYRVIVPGVTLYNTAAKYNIFSDTWTSIANIPVTTAYHATAAIGTDIYLLGGASTAIGYQTIAGKKMYRYNTLTNTWSADLATATTPDPIYGGAIVNRADKLLFSYGDIVARQYDPVTHVLSYFNNYDPVTANTGFYNGFAMAVAGDKMYLTGRLRKSGDPYPPFVYPLMQYEINLASATTPPLRLNVCGLAENELYIYKYNIADDKFYGMGAGTNSFIFSRAGSEPCSEIAVLKGYWSYMKKN